MIQEEIHNSQKEVRDVPNLRMLARVFSSGQKPKGSRLISGGSEVASANAISSYGEQSHQEEEEGLRHGLGK
jgi:hypothetical protein